MQDMRLKKTQYDFDGRSFELCCNMNVLAEVQEKNGGEIASLLNARSTLKSVMLFMAEMLNDYADSQGWPERYTAKQVGRMISPSELSAITDTVMDLVISAIKSDPAEEDEKN